MRAESIAAARPAWALRPAAVRGLWVIVVMAVACLLPLPAGAAQYALLIGVSDYPQLPRRLWLQGPRNDVALMREVLLARGLAPANLRQLVSRAGGADEPTRGNILAAMQALQARVQAGDQIVFYFAGHGSQQPQPADHGDRPTEPDGLDEVLLPADVERWNGSTSEAAIPHALLDAEIGEWIDSVVDRGATVWAIFDTCHAAGMARGAQARTRAVSPADLGLPVRKAAVPSARPSSAPPQAYAARTPPAAIAESRASSTSRTDGRVLLFATRSHESAGEEWLPRSAALGQNRLQGVFTFHLAQALAAQAKPTAPALLTELRAAYARERRSAPVPQATGSPALPLQ